MSQINAQTSTDKTVIINEYKSSEEASHAATTLASNAFGRVCPVILFEQGGRICASTAIPVGLAVQILVSDPVDKKASMENVQKSHNRPIDKLHVRAVSKYISTSVEEENKYILPSLTVNAVQAQQIFTIKKLNNNFTRLGYLVLNEADSTLTVTDGQHRLEALKSSFRELSGKARERLKNDSISIMFSFESDINQIHQDFADCSKTKALPKSMIAVYDRRVPANGLILDIIDKCSIFNNGLTDSTSVSLSKKSNSFVLTNSIRGMLKSLMAGQHSMADKTFDERANKILATKEDYDKHLEDYISIFNNITRFNSVLTQISQLPQGPQRQQIVEYRDKYLIANPFGLVFSCLIIFRYLMLGNNNLESFIERLMTEIDWKKSNPIWHGNVLTEKEGKYAISSTNKSVSAAIVAIGKQLEISLEPQENLI